MIRLVVTADDVGLAPGLTRGALLAHEQGVVTACSVAGSGAALPAAARELRRFPDLDVGAHLVLTGERPLSPPAEIRSLVGRDDRLLPGFRALAWRQARGILRPDEIALELGRQIERLREHGLVPMHVNGHQHLHLLPAVFPVVCALAVEHGARFVRIAHDPAPGWRLPRGVELRALNYFGSHARRRLPPDLLATAITIGIADAGHLHGVRLDRAVQALAGLDGTAELVCHPGSGNDELRTLYDWAYDWDEEAAALCAGGLRARWRESGVALSSFRELAALA